MNNVCDKCYKVVRLLSTHGLCEKCEKNHSCSVCDGEMPDWWNKYVSGEYDQETGK